MAAVVALIGDVTEARSRGVSDAKLDLPRKLQRRAQFMLDFVEAENSSGFHAPQEAEPAPSPASGRLREDRPAEVTDVGRGLQMPGTTVVTR